MAITFNFTTTDLLITTSDSSPDDTHPHQFSKTEEYFSAIIPCLIGIHNSFWCIYFFYKFGCCKNKFAAVSIGMKRSASFVFITHFITPFYMGCSNFNQFIRFVQSYIMSTYPCRADFILQTLLYTLSKFALFVFFTFRIDVIVRDSFFEYKRLQSWLLRLGGFIAFIAFFIAAPFSIEGELDDDHQSCILDESSYLGLYVGAGVNALLFMLVIIVFARKICQVIWLHFVYTFYPHFRVLCLLYTLYTQKKVASTRSNGISIPSMDGMNDDNGSGFGLMYSVGYNAKNESFKLIESLQYHTLLISLNVLIEIVLLIISSSAELSAICLTLSIFCDIWCLLLMFRRIWFKKYCNYCLKVTKPLWRCCGINLPQLYTKYDPNEQHNQLWSNNEYSAAQYNNDSDYYYDQNQSMMLSSLSNYERPSIWSKFSSSKNKKKYKKNGNMNQDMYQPLTDQYNTAI